MPEIEPAGPRELPTVAAFYLPQFHPIEENDRFWGPGFTEWRNVVQARPLFDGHDQPRIPTELGFYDLRLPEVQHAQAALAREHGIGAFCYYHYWFNGRTVMDRPFSQVLADPSIDLPFFLCWANENWTRRWDGLDDDVLLKQEYSPDDDLAHIRALLPALADDRYLRVEGRPVVLIYRSSLLPDACATADRWRTEVARAGLGDLHLCSVESLEHDRGDPAAIGFDAAVEFQPDWTALGEPEGRTWGRELAARRLGRRSVWLDNEMYSYDTVATTMMSKPPVPYLRHPCVVPQWDNTARRRTGAIVLTDATPGTYQRWLKHTVDRTVEEQGPLVFINAWNEWAEGAYLEPDVTHGRAYLEATRAATACLR